MASMDEVSLKYHCISSEVIHDEDISQVDANGCAVCPDCHEKIKVGTAGVQNMHKKHRNSQNCKNTIAKKHREKKNLKNSTLDGFLRPKPAFITSTVQSIPLIRSFPAVGEGAPIALPLAVNSGLEESKLLHRIQKIAENLPDDVPIASSQDKLASGFWNWSGGRWCGKFFECGQKEVVLTLKTQLDTPLPSGSENGSLSVDQPLLQPVLGISEGPRRMVVEPSGRSKRKRQAFAIGDLCTCICGEVANPQSEDVIPCKQMGCESKWVSFNF